MTTGACPRCAHPLAAGYGALGEDACGECGGHVLSPDLTRRVLLDEGGLDPRVIQQLAREFAGKKLTCSRCGQAMSPVTLKGTPVDICFACGTTFLDAGELERLSAGRHTEHAPPPSRIRPVDQLAPVDEKPPDPRATWEKAVPLYLVEAWAVWALLVARDLVSTPLVGVGAALGIVAIPLGLSTLVDVDLRGLILRHRRRAWGASWGSSGYYTRGLAGIVLFIVALFVAGTISTVNAMIAERFPRLFSTRNALVALGALLVTGVVTTVL